MEVINNIQADILENLARFKFLSTTQLKKLTGKSISYTREQITSLYERKYIKAYHLEKPSKAENIYYLSEHGKDVLLQNDKAFADDIKIPKGVPLVVRDYVHRKNFIDIHIALYFYLKEKGITIEKFDAYFDKQGNNRTAHNLEAKTKIDIGNNETYMPDGVMITNNFEEKEMYLIEMYNGKDTGRVVEQLAKHGRAIALGTPAKKYNIQKNPIILSIFEFDSIKQAVIKRLESNPKFAPISNYFYFGYLSEIQEGKVESLFTVHGEVIEYN
jgi:hypothetical protein